MVMEALTDHDPTIRAEACRALEDLGAVDALEDLRARVEDLVDGSRCEPLAEETWIRVDESLVAKPGAGSRLVPAGCSARASAPSSRT